MTDDTAVIKSDSIKSVTYRNYRICVSKVIVHDD